MKKEGIIGLQCTKYYSDDMLFVEYNYFSSQIVAATQFINLT